VYLTRLRAFCRYLLKPPPAWPGSDSQTVLSTLRTRRRLLALCLYSTFYYSYGIPITTVATTVRRGRECVIPPNARVILR